MNGRNQVTAIVHGHVGLVIKDGIDMVIVGLLILAFNGIGRNTVLTDQGGCDIVLCRKRIGGAEHEVGASSFEGNRKVCCLCSNMEAARHAYSLERQIFRKTLPEKP